MQTFAGSPFHANGCVLYTSRKRLIIKYCLTNAEGIPVFMNQRINIRQVSKSGPVENLKGVRNIICKMSKRFSLYPGLRYQSEHILANAPIEIGVRYQFIK
jgi:hypothetical protein